MSRKFRYHAEPEEIRSYVENLGFRTEEYYHQSGEPSGFKICDTYLSVGYGIIENGERIAFGLVVLFPDVFHRNEMEEERSSKLYRKLYRKFRKPRTC